MVMWLECLLILKAAQTSDLTFMQIKKVAYQNQRSAKTAHRSGGTLRARLNAKSSSKYQNQSSWVPQMPSYKYYNQLECKANNKMPCRVLASRPAYANQCLSYAAQLWIQTWLMIRTQPCWSEWIINVFCLLAALPRSCVVRTVWSPQTGDNMSLLSV